ncbi:J domain-containing protein [Rufibacter sp. XAAS-G3-1]|uniref:J domain-containing protein n=1 Tax=Rufibacter sp. XAAS-G3-1 TaxID=2729134 RepID=UPI0015E658E0|nr:J domain-containing protein [Rufibacter sp. XAAS-G3-1]
MLAESYRVLGVPFGAEMPQIRHAYRRLVLQYHPDRNQEPEAHAMFLRVQSAYEYLQRFQELASAPAAAHIPPPPPAPKPQTDWEKYEFVYDPPTDPKEYVAWAAVARERARRQKEKDHAAYVQRTLAMKQKWWYALARYSSYVVLGLGMMTGVAFILIPFIFLFLGEFKPVLLGIIMVPMGIKMMQVMREFRQDIKKHFGEDLPVSPK